MRIAGTAPGLRTDAWLAKAAAVFLGALLVRCSFFIAVALFAVRESKISYGAFVALRKGRGFQSFLAALTLWSSNPWLTFALSTAITQFGSAHFA